MDKPKKLKSATFLKNIFSRTNINAKITKLCYLTLVVLVVFIYANLLFAKDTLLVFAGAASKPATEKIAKLFEKKTGIKVELVFGGSGFVLSQMILAKRGDIYFPGSSDYMEMAKTKATVLEDTERYVVYLVPAINVQKGNPKNIRSLKDFTRPGIRVGIANPEGVCIGGYSVEIIEKNLTSVEKQNFKKNIVCYLESCEKTATSISLKSVDAVIGWSVFEHWNHQRIETVPLKKEEIIRIGYMPIAISSFTKNRQLAQKFIDFVLSEEGKNVFKEYKYFTTPEEAFRYVGEKKPIGGKYEVPADWYKK